MTTEFQKTVLDNGVRVLTERHPGSQSSALGIWTTVGSRDESKVLSGAAHFLEHLVFKGTRTRSAFDIAATMERVGGEINAFTTREETCYHVECLKEDLTLGIDVLSDILLNPLFRQEDFELERSVILQELAMYADSPEENIYDLFYQRVFQGHGLGQNILGTEESLNQLSVDDISNYFNDFYTPDRWIVTATGDFEHAQIVDEIEKRLGGLKKNSKSIVRSTARFNSVDEKIQKDSEQIHILFGIPAPTYGDETRFEMNIVSTLLGGGMTSRLYQKVREGKGLAYSVFAHLGQYTDTGLLNIYAGTDRKNADEVVSLLKLELEKLITEGISSDELRHCQTQIRGGLLMASDDIDSRMHSIGISEIVYGEYRTLKSIVDSLMKVTVDSVHNFLKEWGENLPASQIVYGPID